MKKILLILFPVVAGVLLMFLALPLYGGDLNLIVKKVASDWEVPFFAIQILFSIGFALVFSVIFFVLKRLAIWVAILAILLFLGAPALFLKIPIIPEEIRTAIEEKIDL